VGLIKFERMLTTSNHRVRRGASSPKTDKIAACERQDWRGTPRKQRKLPLFGAENVRQSRRIYYADGNNRSMMTFAPRTTILAVRNRGVCFDVRL
jgi:hypothetical protein